MQLDIQNLVVDRGARRVIDSLTTKLNAGETLTLLGPNGAGKSTLIRAIAGFIAPMAGSIALTDDTIESDATRAESCHYIGHLNGTKSSLTVSENLAFWSRYLERSKHADSARDVENALSQFNLFALADIPAGYLSAGQQRRLALARLLVARRPLWLLDEPTVSLDSNSVALLAKAIENHTDTGGMVVAATHIPLGLKNARELHLAVCEAVA